MRQSKPARKLTLSRAVPIRPAAGGLYIAGEAGLVLRFDAAAQRFRAVPVDYRGSLFGVVDGGGSGFLGQTAMTVSAGLEPAAALDASAPIEFLRASPSFGS